MKIQEMKSGSLHLSKKVEDDGADNFAKIRPESETIGTIPLWPPVSELYESRWSVISFSHREGEGLTYKEAVDSVSGLDSLGVSGLCIVTDDAADRMIR